MKKKINTIFFKAKNIYSYYSNTWKRQYCIFGIKYTTINKYKTDFFKKQKYAKNLKKYNDYKKVLDELDKNRKNTNPLLTIVLITYQHHETIEMCIESILSQETKYSYIIKIYDDASNDGTSEICFEYAKKYPEKIQYILQQENTKGWHFQTAIKSIKSKYWCFIDGDDRYTSNDKIESALDFLESHPDYATFANDFLCCENSVLPHFGQKLPKGNQDISLEHYTYLHPTSRIHRRIYDDYDKTFPKLCWLSDYPLYFLHLIGGKCYFEDKIKSIWNLNYKGMYLSKSQKQRIYADLIVDYNLNQALNFKYNNFFIKKWRINNKKIIAKSYLPNFILDIFWNLYLVKEKNYYEKAEKRILSETYKQIKINKQWKGFFLRKKMSTSIGEK